MPLPSFNYKGRLYALKLAGISGISPFIGVIFPVIWFTDQIISLATPLRDFAYTICYYNELDFNNLADNRCNNKNRAEIILIVGLVAYSYRIMQCMRQGYDKGEYLWTH